MNNNELIKGCQRDHRQSQKRLYDKYSSQMFGICLRYALDHHMACDALQDGFISVFENINQLTDANCLEAWLKKIMIRSCLQQLRKQKQFNVIHLDELAPSIELGLTDPMYENNYNFDKLLQHLESMPAGYRTIFSLYVLDEYSHQEISEMLGIQIGTSRSQLLKARQYMRNLIINDTSLITELKINQ